MEARADLVVAGDRHLLTLKRFEGIPIVRLADFLRLFPARAPRPRPRAGPIPALLLAVASIHDRRVARSDRSADLRTLARWFAEADSDSTAPTRRAQLAAAAAAEARQIEAAPRRLASGARVRLSDLGALEPMEFSLFLDLLGDALAVKVGADEVVEVISSDGTMHVALEPTGDDRTATIVTSTGRFSGRDHYLRIRDLVGDAGEAIAAPAPRSAVMA